jgi:hypothetical protein
MEVIKFISLSRGLFWAMAETTTIDGRREIEPKR